jgi:hypothetical protein
MRYQIRLLDQNLPGLAREIATACWHSVDGLVPERVGNKMYRSLYRAVRTVFKARVQAFRYCGAARICEHSLPPSELARTPAHERFPAEHLHVFLMAPESPPEVLAGDIVRETLKAVVGELPSRRLKGLADQLKNHIGKVLEGRIFPSVFCSAQTLCQANEAYDPWDMTEPMNAVPLRTVRAGTKMGATA